MSKLVAWVAGWAAATVAIVAWLTSRADIPSEDRLATVVGTGAIAAFVTAAIALAARRG